LISLPFSCEQLSLCVSFAPHSVLSFPQNFLQIFFYSIYAQEDGDVKGDNGGDNDKEQGEETE
jgi:hypothetical protein